MRCHRAKLEFIFFEKDLFKKKIVGSIILKIGNIIDFEYFANHQSTYQDYFEIFRI